MVSVKYLINYPLRLHVMYQRGLSGVLNPLLPQPATANLIMILDLGIDLLL